LEVGDMKAHISKLIRYLSVFGFLLIVVCRISPALTTPAWGKDPHGRVSKDPIQSNEQLKQNLTTYQRLSPEEKAWIKSKYDEWESLPPDKRNRLRRRMAQWMSLPPDERNLMRRRFEQWRHLDPEERQKLREQIDRWDQLDPEQREKIRNKFRKQ
jgi:phage-related protein